MFLKLFLAFTLIPALELWLLLQLGSTIGPIATIGIVVFTGIVGAWLAKREGFAVLKGLAAEVNEGIPPGSRLAEGALVVIGGVLLITPGVLTDLTGFLLIAPPSRRYIAPYLVRAVLSRVDVSTSIPQPGTPQSPKHRTPFSSPFDDLP